MGIHILLFLVLPFLLKSVIGSAFLPPVNTKETCIDDIKGLTALQTGFNLESWSADPCTGLLPLYWIRCSSDPSPRVTALDLGGLGLNGPLPDFSSMNALRRIDFSFNRITGPVPSFIASFPNLTLLNLANNDFSGTLPADLSALSSTQSLALVTTGNPKLYVYGISRDETSIAAEAPTTTRMLAEISPSPLPTTTGDLPGTPDEPNEPTTTEPTTTVPTTDTPTTPHQPSSTTNTQTVPLPPPASGGGSSNGAQLGKIIGGSFSAFTALSGIAGFFTIRHRKKKKKKKAAASAAATVVTVTIEHGTNTKTQSRSNHV